MVSAIGRHFQPLAFNRFASRRIAWLLGFGFRFRD
jgi:hypothetical protein